MSNQSANAVSRFRLDIRFEVALGVLDGVASCYAERVGIERSRPSPDIGKLQELAEAQQVLWHAREALNPRDGTAIENAISHYGAAYRRLAQVA